MANLVALCGHMTNASPPTALDKKINNGQLTGSCINIILLAAFLLFHFIIDEQTPAIK